METFKTVKKLLCQGRPTWWQRVQKRPPSSKKEKDITCTLSEPETNMIGGGAAGDGVHYGRLMAAIYHWKKLATPSEWAITGPAYRNNYRSIDTKGRWLAACLHCRHAHINPRTSRMRIYTGCPARDRRSNDSSSEFCPQENLIQRFPIPFESESQFSKLFASKFEKYEKKKKKII